MRRLLSSRWIQAVSRDVAANLLTIAILAIIGVATTIGVVAWRRAGHGPTTGDMSIVLLVLTAGVSIFASLRRIPPAQNGPVSPTLQRTGIEYEYAGDIFPGDYVEPAPGGVVTLGDGVSVVIKAIPLPTDWSSFREDLRGSRGTPALVLIRILASTVLEDVRLRVAVLDARATGTLHSDNRLRPVELETLTDRSNGVTMVLATLSKGRPAERALMVNAPNIGIWARVEFDWFLDAGSRRIASDTFRQFLF